MGLAVRLQKVVALCVEHVDRGALLRGLDPQRDLGVHARVLKLGLAGVDGGLERVLVVLRRVHALHGGGLERRHVQLVALLLRLLGLRARLILRVRVRVVPRSAFTLDVFVPDDRAD